MSVRCRGIKMNERGQVSIEFIIVAGAVLLVAISIYPFAMQQQELNKAVAAARDGASYGAGLRGMGFTPEGGGSLPGGVIKIERMEVNRTGVMIGDLKEYQITFFVYAPTNMRGGTDCGAAGNELGGTIINQSLSYIHRAFYGTWNATIPIVNTSYSSFSVTCNFI
jgi:hypothetical protein